MYCGMRKHFLIAGNSTEAEYHFRTEIAFASLGTATSIKFQWLFDNEVIIMDQS